MYAFRATEKRHIRKDATQASIDHMPHTKDTCLRVRYADGTSTGFWFSEKEWAHLVLTGREGFPE